MASSSVTEEETFQCSKCVQVLDLASKTLPCLHSFCASCVEMILGGNRLCPQCQQRTTGDDLRLAPFLVKSLRRRQLESGQLNCDTCSEEGNESTGEIWCQDCQEVLCQTCGRFHKKFHAGHETKDLSGVSRVEAIRVIMRDDCRRHRQRTDAFCDRCNVCLCKECYKDHVTASPRCPPRPLSVREEASKVKKEDGPNLERELYQFEIHIKATNERTKRSIDKMSRDCDSERLKLAQDFEEFVEVARLRLAELCDNMKVMAAELATKWRNSLQEREELLAKVKIWRETLGHLLRDDNADDADVVCGLALAEAELSARRRQSFSPAEKGRWVVTFPKWCHDSLETLKKEIAAWTPEGGGHLQFESECPLQRSKPSPSFISSIVVSDEDNHVFVGDWIGGSIVEFTDSGELVGEFPLTDGGEGFYPWEMCRLPEDILVVSCPRGSGSRGGSLFYLARQKYPPFLKTQIIIDTKEKKFFSLCEVEKNIFACEFDFEEIVCFNENGEKIKTIHPRGSPGEGGYVHCLRADPTTLNLLGARGGGSKIFVWNQNGEILKKFEIKEGISDFCANKFGNFYFSTQEGIFSVLPEKKFYKFPKKSEGIPKIFVSRQKLFVSFKNDGENVLKIFKIN